MGGVQATLIYPAGFDPDTPTNVVYVQHGATEDSSSIADGTNPKRPIVRALTDAGYVVGSISVGDSWGNSTSLDRVAALDAYVRGRVTVDKVGLLGQSMGGIRSALMVTDDRVTDIVAIAGIYPAYNLRSIYDIGGGNKAQIETAYGLALDGSDYSTKTSGHDPVLCDPSNWAGIHFRFYASPDDTMVPKATNSDQFDTLIAGVAASHSVVTCSGQHGDASHFQPANVAAFFAAAFA